MAVALREFESLERACYVARRTQIGEYPFWCQMFVRFIYLPAQIFCPKRPLRLGWYAFRKWGYSEIHGQSICTSRQRARMMIGNRKGWFIDEAPVNVCEPESLALYGQHVFPNSDIPEAMQCPKIEMVAQRGSVCDEISEVTELIHRRLEQI